MMDHVNEGHSVIKLIEFIIEKQRIELIRIVERHHYNFQSKEVIAASIEMDHWLNFYIQSCTSEQDIQKK
jgi:hypothetical protein